MIYLISLVVFAGVMFVLVGLLLLVEAKVVELPHLNRRERSGNVRLA